MGDTGTISVTGVSAGGNGVFLGGSGSTTTGAGGSISIMGTTTGTSTDSDGVFAGDSALSTMGDTATISVTGVSAGDDGVFLGGSGSTTTGAGGSISIMGTTTGTSTDSDGVAGSGSAMSTDGDTATIGVTGITAGDDGIELLSDSDVTTAGAVTATITLLGTTTGNNGADSDGVLINAAGSDVTITSAAGAIAITGTASNASGDGVEIQAGIGLAIDANGAATVTITGTGDEGEQAVQVDSPIESETGAITIRSLDGGSTNDDIVFGAGGDITSTSGAITLNADNAGTTADVFMADGAIIDAGTGLIDIDAEVDVTIGSLVTTTDVQINAIAGAIIDGGDADTDIMATTAALRASVGIGDAGTDASDIDTSIDSLAATTVTGDISISDDAGLDITTVDGLAGVTISTGGAGDDILIREGNAAGSDDLVISQIISNAGVGDVTLFAGGAASQDDNLNINADITATGGDVLIVSFEDVDFSLAPTVSTNGTGTITIHAGRVFNFGAALTLGSTTADILEGGANEYTVQTADGTVRMTATRNIELETVDAGATGTFIITADSDLDGIGAITDALAAETANITAMSAALQAGDGIGSGEAADDADLDLVVSNVAAVTNTGDIHIQNTGGLTIGTVDSLAGVTIIDGGDANGGEDITIRAASPLTVSAGTPVVNNAGGNITLAAEGSATTDDLTINDAVTALGGDGNISLFAGDTISLAAITIGAAGVGMVVLSAGSDFNNATLRDGNSNGDILMTSGAAVQSEGGDITLHAPNDVQVSIVNADSDAGGAIGDVVIIADFAGPDTSGGASDTYDSNSSGAVSDVLTGEAANLTANIAILTAATGIGSADDLDTDLAQVNVANSTSGNVMITEIAGAGDNALEVTSVSNITGNIDIRTEDGDLTFSGAATTTTTGTITLVAGDSDNDGNGDLILQAAVTSATGQVTLTSAGNDVNFRVAADVTTSMGEIEVNAGAFGTGTITMTDDGATDATVLDAGSGLIDINGVGDVTVGSVVTTNTTANAVNIAATVGAILDGGDFADDIIADGGTTTLAAGTSIGTAGNGLDTTIDRLAATASFGVVHLDETNGLSAISVTATGAGNDVDISSTTGDILVGVVTAPDTITLTAADGGVEELAGGEADADSDLVATTLDLDATVGIGDGATLEVTTTSIAADTTNNNIDLLNQNPGVAVTATSLTTGTGTIDFVQTGNEALTVTLAQTTDGTITIQNTGDADADALTLTSVTAGGTGEVNATTLTAGDVLVGSATADTNTVTITSAGAINDAAADSTIDITVGTGTIDLNAVDGIGNMAALELAGTSISSDTSAGAIDLDNGLATDVTVTSLTTVGSTITFDQSGGGNVSFDGTVSSGNAGTAGDDILLSAANGDLTINAAVESRSADVTATSTENIVVTAPGSITSVGGNVVLNSDTDTATSSGGGIRVLGTVNSTGGNITLGGGADPATTNTVATTTSGNDGIQIVGGTLDAGSGDISLRGSSALDDGVGIQNGATIQTTSGTISLNGTSTTVSGNDGVEITGIGTTVTSATGSISVTGVGFSGDGVDVSSAAVVASTGTATITIGGTSTAADQAGVRLQDTNTQITSVDGDVSITGTNNSNLGAFVTSGVEISSTGTGASAATITITGTGDAGIDLDTADTLVTSVDGEILLDGNANTLEGILIADATISSTGTTVDAATVTLDGSSDGAVSVQLDNGSTVTSVAGNIQLIGDSSAATANGVELQSGSTVSSTGNGAVFASITMMGTGGTANDGIHIDGSIESVNGNIQLTGVTSNADGDDGLDLDAGQIQSTGTGTILLVGNGQTNGLEIDSSITSNSGTITLQSVDDSIEVELSGNVTSTSGNVTIAADMTAGGAAGQFLMADGSDVLVGMGTIDIDAEGDITIGLLQTNDASNVAVTIDTATGRVIDAGNASTLNIDATAGRAVINAVTGVGSADALETNLASLDVDNSTSGNINIAETDAVTIFDAQQATAGNIIITAEGTLTVDNGGAVTNAVSTAGAGTISLSASGIDSNFAINDGILSDTGDITVIADNDISIAAAGDISSSSGNVTVTADGDGGADSSATGQGSLTMTDRAVIDAGTGTINLNANEDVTLGQLVTTNATTSAIQITSNAGGVVDGGDTDGADIITASGRTLIDAATGIGAADPLETNVESIDADSTTGAIDIDNSLASTTTVISLTTVGGTVNFDQTGGGDLSIIGDVTSGSVGPDVDGGNIELTSTVDLTVAGTANISSAAGAGGLLSINETTVNAGAVITIGAGDVTLNGSGQDTVINATITAATSATFTATRDVIVGATITTTNADADIVINANTDDGTAVGAGGVQIQTAGQLVAGRDVTITGSDLFVTNAAGVFDSIEIQNDSATDQIIANRHISLTSRVASPVGADILVLGELLATTGSINVDALDRTILNDNVDAGMDVTFRDAVDISADLTVTAGNDVTFFSTVDEFGTATGSDLIVNGDGVTRFNAEVGGTSPLESLITNAAGSTQLEANVTADNGAITLADAVLLTGNVTVTNTSAASINFNNTLDSQIGEHNSLIVTAATGQVVFDGDIGASVGTGADDLMPGSVTITSAVGVTFGNNDGVAAVMTDGSIDIGSATTIGASGITFDGVAAGTTIETTSAAVRINGAVTLNTDLRIDTDETAVAGTGGANVTFTNDTPIDSQVIEGNDLTIDAGTAQVFFNEDIGNAAADTELGLLVIEEATGGVTFGNADTETPGTGASGQVNVISLVGDGAATALDIGSVTTIGGSGIVFNGGPGVGDTLSVDATGADVRVNGVVTLNSSVVITTGSSVSGDVTFTNDSPIDAQGGESNNLTLTAGTGSVFFNEDIGTTEKIGALTITRADGGVFFGESDAETPGDGTTGPVNSVSTDAAIDIGSTNVIAGGIMLNGGATGIAFQTTDDNVRLNGPVTLQSATSIDTGVGVGDITFTSDSPIDAGDGTNAAPLGTTLERHDLLLDAGDGAVFFNASIGDAQRLKDLTVDRAAGGVTFGSADTATSGAAGPVNSVSTDGAIDIGSGTTAADVITGGIVLNGAATGITFQTSSDTIRLNGPITLNSDVNLDTVNADVTFTNDASIDGQVGESNALTIDAGTESVFFNENIGENQSVGGIIVEQADSGVFFGTAETETVNGDAGSVDIVRTNGDSDIGSVAAIAGDISLNAGSGAGDIFEWVTDGNSSRFNGVVKLDSSDVRISSGASGGDVTFEDDLLPEVNETVDLTLTAGTGNITFGDVVGTTILRFDDITVVSAADVTAQQAVETTTFTQTNGTGTATFNGTLNTTDAALPGIDINNSGITFNGAVTTTGDGRVFLTNQGGTLTIAAGATFNVDNTFVQDGTGDVVVNANITTTNDEIRFSPTTDPTADVQAAASITLADGTVFETGGNADIRLRAEGDITLSRLVTSSVDGLISVQSDAGAIIDNGDTGGADIVSHNVALRAATGIGDDGKVDPALNVAAVDLPSATDSKVEASAIDTQVKFIAASNTTSGDIQISNTVGGLLTIGTTDGLSGITNDDDNTSDDTVADGPNGGVIWITNASPIDVSSPAAPNDAEGVRNSAGGSVILTAVENAASGDDIQVFAPIEVTRGIGSLLLNAGDDLTLNSQLLTGIGSSVTLRDRAGNIDLNAGNVLTINDTSEVFDIQTGSLLEDVTSGADTSVISQAHRETDFQTNRQIRYTQGPDTTDLVLESGALLATNIVHQVDPATGDVVDNRILSNSGVIADVEPLLVEETFVTDQVRSDGYARISGRFGRALDTASTGGLESEVNFRVLVAWGDDTFSFHHLTGETGDAIPEIVDTVNGTLATGEMIIAPEDDPMGSETTSRTFFFEHFYNGDNLPDPDNPGSPIQIRIFLQGDPNIVQVDANDKIAAYDNSADLLGGETPVPESFLANDEQFLINELLSPDLDAANLGDFGTGLSARVDTYRTPSTPGEVIAGVRNPSFNTVEPNAFGATFNLTTGLPAIVDFQFEEAATIAFDLDLADQPNSDDASITVNVPGDGVESANITLVFDLNVNVPALDFPQSAEVLEAFVITAAQKENDSGARGVASQSEEAAATERIVWLKVLRPTGQTVQRRPAIVADEVVYSPLRGGGYRVLRVVEEVPLDEEVLDNLPKLIFEKLPDGQYQIWLQEPGEKEKRFVMDVTIRDGRPADDKAGARDRPPTSLKKGPAVEEGVEQPPVRKTTQNVEDGTDRKVSVLDSTQMTRRPQTVTTVDAADYTWSRWGQQSGSSPGNDQLNVMAELRGGQIGLQSGEDSELSGTAEDTDSTESRSTIHPIAASAILAAGSVMSKRKQDNWEERIDETMAQWDKLKHEKKSQQD